MMKLTIVCQACGRTLSMVEKDSISQDDVNMYVSGSSCATDGPFPAQMGLDENGDPIIVVPAVENNQIISVKTQE